MVFDRLKTWTWSVAVLVAGVMLITACGMKKEVFFSGRTMGTTYHVTVIAGRFKNLDGLKARIDQRLEQINNSMSTFRPNSEICRFNRIDRAGETITVDKDFARVMAVAKRIYKETGGAWDGTVKPLVDLWGFGNGTIRDTLPSDAAIASARAAVGFDRITITDGDRLGKTQADVTLDLASIAKGYGVDAVSDLIRNAGYPNHLVEIGGEVYAAGHRIDGKPWIVGISSPDPRAPETQIYGTVKIENGAFATSGDYRNFFEYGGHRYAHVIDPHTGWPVSNGVVSASVAAKTCVFADGLATALMVMGPKAAVDLVNRLDGVECLILVLDRGALREYASAGFYGRKTP